MCPLNTRNITKKMIVVQQDIRSLVKKLSPFKQPPHPPKGGLCTFVDDTFFLAPCGGKGGAKRRKGGF